MWSNTQKNCVLTLTLSVYSKNYKTWQPQESVNPSNALLSYHKTISVSVCVGPPPSSQVVLEVKNLPASAGDRRNVVQSLGQE